MAVKKNIRPHGEVRQSQMLTTYGPGALVDLPKHAVIVGGLEGWSTVGRQPIIEERLIEKLRPHFGGKTMGLFTPPAEDALSSAATAPSGITVWQFPRWFVAQYEVTRPDGSRSRPLVLQNNLVRGGYDHAGRKSPWPVVPVRFVQACVNGHIDDIDWRYFVHGKGDPCRRQMWLDERGTSGDFTEIFIRCECGKPARSLSSAKGDGTPLGMCRGRRPWISPTDYEACDRPNRLLVRHASNAWFSQCLSVIHIPDAQAKLKTAVDLVWHDFLKSTDSAAEVKYERKKEKVFNALEGFTDDEVYAEVERRKSNQPVEEKSVKQVEVETLMAQTEQLIDALPDDEFFASALPKPTPKPGPKSVMAKVEKIVLVHRLREVKAQLGFTRFEGGTTTEDGELDLPVGLAPLAAEPTWLPAVENRGEGVFIAFKASEVQAWLGRKAVDARAASLSAGLNAWTTSKGKPPRPYSPTYAMLHSLSHLLIAAVSLECGYSSSAVRERVYASKAGLGILLYTGTSDAEGTLGGLANVGRHFEHHLKTALDMGRLCSNDPVCAQHRPDSQEEARFLHGAACHGCLLISEHSCEMKNEYLDRALVVPTVGGHGSAFFDSHD